MTRFGAHAGWFVFTSDRLDQSSELPPEVSDVFAQAGVDLRRTE